jgi:hypothetical protein
MNAGDAITKQRKAAVNYLGVHYFIQWARLIARTRHHVTVIQPLIGRNRTIFVYCYSSLYAHPHVPVTMTTKRINE